MVFFLAKEQIPQKGFTWRLKRFPEGKWNQIYDFFYKDTKYVRKAWEFLGVVPRFFSVERKITSWRRVLFTSMALKMVVPTGVSSFTVALYGVPRNLKYINTIYKNLYHSVVFIKQLLIYRELFRFYFKFQRFRNLFWRKRKLQFFY